jgi:hypothetical protein
MRTTVNRTRDLEEEMSDQNTNPCRKPGNCVPGERERKNAPAIVPNKNPWDDNEPAWPGAEHEDDEAVADGMCDDDNDAPWPWMSAVFGSPQPSLWDEAISRVLASKSRSEPF